MPVKPYKNLIQSTTFASFLISTYAYSSDDLSQINQTQYNQFKQRIEQLESNQLPSQVNLQQSVFEDVNRIITNEDPCFKINSIEIKTAEDSQVKFAPTVSHFTFGEYAIIDQCIGQQGLNQIARSVQNELLKQGYVTSRALIEPQDLSTGVLVVSIIPGRLNKVWLSEQTTDKVYTSNAVVLDKDDVINVKDIETSLENFRLPQSANANIQIIPSIDAVENADFGSSDLMVDYKKDFPLHFNLSIDDAGSKDTGEFQATLTTTLDNPFNVNDVLDVSYTHTIDPVNNTPTKANNQSIYASYTYPFKNWQLRLSHSDYGFNQTLIGLNDNIVYSGETAQTRAELQRVLFRNTNGKTWLTLGGYHRNSKNLFDEEEIEVQRRKTSGWNAKVSYQRQMDIGQLNFELGYKKGTGAFNAIPAPESFVSDVDSRAGVWSASTGLVHPFVLNKGQYQYKIRLNGQYSRHNLTPQERFSIGGRYSVRGFSDEQGLSGDTGLVLQQEVGRILGVSDVTLMPYVTLDQGMVNGASTEFLAGKQLMGTSLGVRVFSPSMSLDAFVGRGLKAPKQMDKSTAAGFRFSIFY